PGARHWSVSQANLLHKGTLIDLKPAQYFSRAWMSRELSSRRQKEWIQVDLGADADIQEVRLDWLERASKGEVQLSYDGEEWHTVGSLPDKADRYSLHVRGRGRYVRLLLTEGRGRHYTLASMVVMGRGGVTAEPLPPPEAEGNRLPLTRGDWALRRAGANTWLPATVPGTVLQSFIDLGAVPNPNYSDNNRHISESFFHSTFFYRRTFRLPANWRRERLYLCLDGINWKSRVWLNGRELGRTEGAFRRSRFEISNLVKEGTNELLVECRCNDHFGAAKEKNHVNTAINGGTLGADNPTFHASVGWDWINTTRGREVGIWNDVYLETTGGVTLADPFVPCRLALPDTSRATITPEVVVGNDGPEAMTGRLEFRIAGTTLMKRITVAAGEHRTETIGPLRLLNPRLWWPNGYGNPHTYEAQFRFIPDDGGMPTDLDFCAGLRQMTWSTDGGRLTLWVNGRRFIGRGGNWGFPEHNLTYRQREYETAVRYHRDMGFTLIRNWVGQTGDDEFYDACDKYG
ncbi:MAG: discoidin domain-containing protein, partial [Bacteroidaceae bacterium]|nr:discoidin domain-containing protein [Bacteroidaceae bacterium]